MLAVKKETGQVAVHVTFAGSIDETTDFMAAVGVPEIPLVIDCKGVERINSVGVKNWIRYFNLLAEKKVRVHLEKVPPALVEQLNVVRNFHCGAEILSIMLPFKCGSCKTSLFAAIKTQEVAKLAMPIPPTKCVKCGAAAAFDDIPEEYLEFVLRKPGGTAPNG
jgi:anti-anti-sigma regulatory factor